jgi:hypothetical protein
MAIYSTEKVELCTLHYILYLVSYGILCHCGNLSNDTFYE